MRVLVTGSQGFIGSYICRELLDYGYRVVGIDNYSKYGIVERPHDKHASFSFIQLDLSKEEIPNKNYDYIIAGAAMIGGISYFHKYAYDLLAHNDRVIANTFDYAIKHRPKKIIVLSSSMVFENDFNFPSKEEYVLQCPPPSSSYGFQKLATEYYCRAAYEQYKLPYIIIRPFNCVGVGELEAKIGDPVFVGNIRMMMSHVIPDIVYRSLKSSPDDVLHILGRGNQIRHYTNGRDIARGVRLALESDIFNEDFNISTDESCSVIDLANKIWYKIHGKYPKIVSLPAFKYDVQVRKPCTMKAKRMLGFEAKISLDESIEEVIAWFKERMKYS